RRVLLARGSNQPTHQEHHEGNDCGPEHDHQKSAEQHWTPAPYVPHAFPVDLGLGCKRNNAYPKPEPECSLQLHAWPLASIAQPLTRIPTPGAVPPRRRVEPWR